MSVLVAENWEDYKLLDGGDGMKIERWGDIVLARPDPQIIWPKSGRESWDKYDAIYRRSEQGGGRWEYKRELPKYWSINYRQLKFKVRPTGFKHLGLFPEQAVNWDWLNDKIKKQKTPITLLNLFGYTGGATIAAACAGASVCHVDAAAGMVDWCRENAALNGLAAHPIRYIVDDCLAFVRRENRRQKRYDAIVMDPPSFGRGNRGEIWKLEDQLWELLVESCKLLSDNPLLLLLNCYTAHLSPLVVANMVSDILAHRNGRLTNGELGLPFQNSVKILPCGIYCRWEA